MENRNNPHGVSAEQTGALPVNTSIPTIDLNTLLTPGVYSALYNSGVNQTPYHTPYGEAQNGYSTVTHYNILVIGLETRLTQICSSAYSHNNGYWWRTRHDSGWSTWRKVSSDGHTHDASNITSGILPVVRGGTGVPTIAQLAQSLFPIQIGSLPDTSYNFAITGPGWSGNGYMNFQALMTQLSANGMYRIEKGTSDIGAGSGLASDRIYLVYE